MPGPQEDLTGFGLRVRPSGTKTWVLKYRIVGRQRWLTIGSFGRLTPDAAREVARKEIADVAHGRDPAAERAHQRQARTIAELVDRYLREYVEVHNKPNQQRNARAHLEKLVVPAIGPMKAPSVTREDVKQLHLKHRNAPVLANRMLTTLSRFFNWTEEIGARPEGTNAVHGAKRFKEKSQGLPGRQRAPGAWEAPAGG